MTIIENEYLTALETIFPGLNFQRQYQIEDSPYVIDAFAEYGSIIVEVDEEHHQWDTQEDNERMDQILDALSQEMYDDSPHCSASYWKSKIKVIRIKQGELPKAIREILLHLVEECGDFGVPVACKDYKHFEE